jgi:tetratricopeptide (TPR) repeat protein
MAKKQNQRPVTVSKVQPAPATPQKKIVAEPKQGVILSVKTLCILLAVVSFLLYANTLVNGYVMDDVIVLKENTIVMKGIHGIPELFTTPHMRGYMIIPNDMYRPLSMVMFAIEYQFFGASPAVNHFFNILVFIGCVITLFLFVNRFFDGKKVVVAFIAALIFAIHPIHTEVVANIKSRDELLCFFFAFWSLNLFMDYMQRGRAVALIGGALTLFLSYLSKETVITFLAVIPLLFFVFKKEHTRRAIYITAAMVVVTGLFLGIRAEVLNNFNANQRSPVDFIDNALAGVSGVSKFATEVVIMGKYLWLQFIPYPLLSTYSFNAIPFATLSSISFWLSLLVYLLLAYVVIVRLRTDRKDPWAFAILFFVITLSLFSNIPFLMGAEMAERFAFFASVGICIAVGIGMERWVIKSGTEDTTVLKAPKVLAILVPLLLIFGGMTVARNADWKDNYTLYKADVEKSPENARLYHYLATALAENKYNEETDTVKRREMDMESVGYLRKSLEIYPKFTEARVELARIYDRNKMYDSALAEDKVALALNPGHATGNNNLGSVYLTTGKYAEAIIYFKKAIEIDPNFRFAYINLARTYKQMQQYDSAIIYFNKILSLDPGFSEAHKELGTLYFFRQKYDSSEAQLKLALAMNPGDANSLNTLGAIYLNTKKYPQAIETIKKSVALDPNNITAISNLGRAYYLNNQFAAALEQFGKELTLDPKSPRDVPYMALAYQKLGNMEQARKYEVLAKHYYSNFKLD